MLAGKMESVTLDRKNFVVKVRFMDNDTAEFAFSWLRDNCQLLWTCAVDRSRAERMMKTVGCWFRRVYSLRYILHTSVLQDSYSILNSGSMDGRVTH